MNEPSINTYKLEICSNSFFSALQAEKGGASRIELCQNLENGGTTPSPGQIKLVRAHLGIGVHVLIRPRGGDFVYSKEEFQEMLEDVRFCREVGCDGVVIGVLHADGSVDTERTAALVKQAGAMKTVFHRAFDRCVNPLESLEEIIGTGCHRLLTSGQQSCAWQGRDLIRELITQADGRIEVMPGAGVDESNITKILLDTGARSIHSSAKQAVPSSMTHRVHAFTGMDEATFRTSKERVEELVRQIKSL